MNQITFPTPRPNILIAGAGPVGLLLAIQLQRFGIPYRLIEKNAGPSTYTKAMAIHSRTLEIFDEIGVAQDMINAGHRLNRFRIQSYGDTILTYQFSLLDAKYPFLLCLAQSTTESILLDKLRSLGGDVEWETELTSVKQIGDEIHTTIHHQDKESVFKSTWLAACDGARSTIRRQLDLSFDGGMYHSHFMLADVDIEWDGGTDEGVFFLGDQAGYVAVAPLNDQKRYRLFVEMPFDLPPEDKRLPLTLETFQKLCDGRGQAMKLSNISSETTASFQQRKIQQQQVGHIFFLGDSGHIGSPIGGQYMNMGIAESHNLAWKLNLVAKGLAHPYLLNSYDAERRPVALEVEKTARGLTKILTVKQPQVVNLRDRVFTKLSQLAIIKNKLPWMISGHRYNYRTSPNVLDRRAKVAKKIQFRNGKFNFTGLNLPKAGDLAADIELWTARDQHVSRLYDFAKEKYSLFIFTGADQFNSDLVDLTQQANEIKQQYNLINNYFVVDALEQFKFNKHPDAKLILDPDWRLHHRYGFGLNRKGYVLVRPDGYIGFLGNDFADLKDYFENYSMLVPNVQVGATVFKDHVLSESGN